MKEKYSIADARDNFPTLVREAEHGKVVGLTRRGEEVAVLIGHQYYEQLATNYQGFSKSYRNFVINVDLTNLDLNPEQLFPVSARYLPERAD